MILKEKEQKKNDHRDGADRDHLSIEISLRAFLDGTANFLHPGIPGGRSDDGENKDEGEDQTNRRAKQRKRDTRSQNG